MILPTSTQRAAAHSGFLTRQAMHALAIVVLAFGVLAVHARAAAPVTERSRKAVEWVDPVAKAPADPAAMATACPATAQGILSGSGSWSGDTTGLTNDFENDYPAGTGSYGSGGADEIHTFQVDTTGVWSFDTSMACWDTSLGLRVDGGGGCPGDAVEFDGDSLSDCYYESLLEAFLVAGTDYFMVVDGWTTGTEGPYTLNYNLLIAACTDDAYCSDGDPCNGDETCNTGNGQCEAGTPPCDRAQTCNPDGSCTDPDGCLIYQNTRIVGMTDRNGIPEGTLVADDWGFETGNLGRTLDNYSTTAVGVTGPFGVATTLWPHGKGCVGGSSERSECDVDADCTGLTCLGGVNDGLACVTTNPDCPGECATSGAPCFFDTDCTPPDPGECILSDCPPDGACVDEGFFPAVGLQRPGRAEIPGTLCVFVNIPSGYYTTLTCTPGSGAVLPADGAWQVMGFFSTGGTAGPALAGQTPEIGTSTDVFAWDLGSNGASWARYWFGGGDLANWTGDLCTVPLGACCDPGLGGTCSISTEAACGGSYIGDNNAVNEFDCGADLDGDGVPDPCDACPDNLDFAADTGPCNCSSSDVDADGTLDCVDACPSNPDFADDQGPCQCSSADADGDDTLDCIDGCPDDPNKIAPGVCGCGVDDNADADGDGVPDCIDQCNGVDDAVFAPECVGAIPTVSDWGLVVLGLLLLAAGKVYFGRRSATT